MYAFFLFFILLSFLIIGIRTFVFYDYTLVLYGNDEEILE